jgi:hypothetical protein
MVDENNNDRYREIETSNYSEVSVRKVAEVEFIDNVR